MIYNTIELTNSKALELENLEIEVLDRLYIFDISTINAGGRKVVNQITVDGYENGEWDDELSAVFYPNEKVSAQDFEWVQFI